ncbi:tyrosine-type recombinase/integrase [Clostridium sp. AM58-1XD]|uniref:tyrosine-type recombinase/integrase n=1 Tax=Clostridium sp. AM58-1XD TaxID=2292307 RepID=UPI000E4C6504|nr:tyrosine-type recombinase/integrase [Clostridium sp. AM58-1XD]RGY96735.1 integrase [Clostridium sp. AM58-1XD]
MDSCIITETILNDYMHHLVEEEKRKLTIEKYIRDLRTFNRFLNGREVTKEIVIEYKERLADCYSVSTVNSILSAINSYLDFTGYHQYRVKQLKQQRNVYCPEEKDLTKEEYFRLIRTAKKLKRDRLGLVIQTICSTGIRVSELSYVTVDAVQKGIIRVECKGKYRQVFLPQKLRHQLFLYIKEQGIIQGEVFVTKGGASLDRSNIWRQMKSLCREAGVAESKVFPHNLRHLFAKTYYTMEKDIAKLADLLGHSNVNTTRIYIMTSGEEHKKQIEQMKLVL